MHQSISGISGAETAPLAAPVRAAMQFIRRQDTKPRFLSAALTGGEPKILYEIESHDVDIHDMRPLRGALSLDREGFVLLDHHTAAEDLYDDAAIEGPYTEEIESLVAGALGAKRVVVFDVTRRADDGRGAKNPDGLRGPATRAHVDYTVKSGPQRVKDVLGENEAARLHAAGTRIVQVNVWRPIKGPVQRSPLALADAASLEARDLIATDQVFPDRVGEIYMLAHNPEQRWYSAPRMTRDEVILIKGWDSLDDGRARFTPHAAFVLPDTPASAPPRESIEVRTLAIFD
jgi:hypothetical protein